MERKHNIKYAKGFAYTMAANFIATSIRQVAVMCFLSISIATAKAQGEGTKAENLQHNSWPTETNDSLLHRNYNYLTDSEPWLTSCNAAALTRFKADNISTARISLTSGHGGLTNFSDSRNMLEAGAEAASYFRINQRTVVAGSISYTNFTGKEMGGSAFISPDRKPFDIEEDSLTNLGKKHLDTYRLTGGVGFDICHGIAVGARLDYTAANYAKYKDLRHKNKMLDMTLAIGAMAPIGKHLHIGANYLYRRNTESVAFNTYGRNEKVYKSFINYGPFIGRVEQFEGNGLTEKGREMPMVDDYNGAALQIDITAGDITFANEITAVHRVGYYGRKSPYTITFTHHESNLYGYSGKVLLRENRNLHLLSVTLDAENLENSFSTYREKSNDNGAYFYEYYDDVKTANKLWINGEAAYTLHIGVKGELPAWTVKAHYRWMHRKQTAYEYPYYRRQKIDNRETGLSITRNLTLRRGVLSLNAEGAFISGKGKPFEDLTFTEPSDKQIPPPTMEAWLYREYRWLTAPQYTLGGSAKYTFVLPAIHTATYVEASARHRKANATNEFCTGRDCTTLTVAVGCHF